MKLDLRTPETSKPPEVRGERRAFVLLESARLRCESLLACFGRVDPLVAIHREIGLAGYITCAEFGPEQRRECLALAVSRLAESPLPAIDPMSARLPEMGRTLARMFSETISASDALAGQLAAHDAEDAQRDRLHLVHAHVMSACELLDERLTVLELQGVGVDAG